ncbi:hypothetical protein M011DRAFT_310183 [Sporormia fimetaria CBS 119925]|uniref:Uncharacterized protein n=1 Tax=Sporormia fimetaria CBS 119925 TaxID=1340428 RepID=A0A6A6VFW8_9PLEO|nr:hypothetical protein M011DRAFT_310183 [Sporormia fimetaria CBS 119925]
MPVPSPRLYRPSSDAPHRPLPPLVARLLFVARTRPSPMQMLILPSVSQKTHKSLCDSGPGCPPSEARPVFRLKPRPNRVKTLCRGALHPLPTSAASPLPSAVVGLPEKARYCSPSLALQPYSRISSKPASTHISFNVLASLQTFPPSSFSHLQRHFNILEQSTFASPRPSVLSLR